jgi:hypothetical protein
MDRDRHAWAGSLGVTGAFVVLAAGLFWFLSDQWVGALHAGTYGDLAQLTGAVGDIWHGKPGAVYGSNLGLLALPLTFLTLLPIAPLLSAMNQSIPSHDPATLIAGTYIVMLGCFALHAVRGLAWDLGVRRHLLLIQIMAALVVLLPEFEYAHLDDVLAFTAVVYAVRRILRQEYMAAALLLSLAISFKQWAFVLVPLVAAASPRGSRLRVVSAAAALPAVLMVLCIAIDGSSATHAFFSPQPSSQLTGHPGFDPNWLGTHSAEASRVLAAALAGTLGVARRRVTDPARLLAAVAVILAIRPLTETVNYSYYWSPALMLGVLALVVAERRITLGAAAWILAALAWSIPRGLDSSPTGWWVCELVLLLAITLRVLRAVRFGHSTPPAGPDARDPGARSYAPLEPVPAG